MARMKTLFSSILALGLLLGLPGPSSATTPACATRYVVQWGDSLWTIAQAQNVDFIALYNLNQLATPDVIFAGQELCLPAKLAAPLEGPTAVSAAPTAAAKTPDTSQAVTPAAATPAPAAASAATPAPACTSLGDGVWNPADIPLIWVAAVEQDKAVTVAAQNFPPNMAFDVRMGPFGTAGLAGTLVGSTNSCKGGAFRATYAIPAGLKTQPQIAIRLENAATGYHAFNYFWNFTAVAIP